jgi:hypothetical protein
VPHCWLEKGSPLAPVGADELKSTTPDGKLSEVEAGASTREEETAEPVLEDEEIAEPVLEEEMIAEPVLEEEIAEPALEEEELEELNDGMGGEPRIVTLNV